MTIIQPDQYALLHDQSDATDIAMHCRNMQARDAMRGDMYETLQDLGEGEAIGMRGNMTQRVYTPSGAFDRPSLGDDVLFAVVMIGAAGALIAAVTAVAVLVMS